jgi:hypothetical protein
VTVEQAIAVGMRNRARGLAMLLAREGLPDERVVHAVESIYGEPGREEAERVVQQRL